MTIDNFVGTFVLGKLLSPAYKRAAKGLCQECAPFITKGSKIIDIGCGRGITTQEFRDYFQAEILGVDVADQRVIDFPFQKIDGKNLPFSNDSFDVALLINVLHHADDPENLLNEAKRITKEKIIICEDLKGKGISQLANWLHRNTYRISAPFLRQPNNFHSREEWKRKFSKNGLKVSFEKIFSQPFGWLYPIKNVLFVLSKKA